MGAKQSEFAKSGFWLGGTNNNSKGERFEDWSWTDGTPWDYYNWDRDVDKDSVTNRCLHAGVVERKVLDHGWCSTWGNMEKCCREMNFVCKRQLVEIKTKIK